MGTLNPKERKEQYVTIKVRTSTRKELIRTKAAYEFHLGERLSMDDIITAMLKSLPTMKVDIKFPVETKVPQ